MFPSTLSTKNAVDMFPRTDRLKDINSINSGHVETCVLLYHKDYTVGEKGKKVTVEVGMNK